MVLPHPSLSETAAHLPTSRKSTCLRKTTFFVFGIYKLTSLTLTGWIFFSFIQFFVPYSTAMACRFVQDVGVELEARNNDARGRTPLHHACETGNIVMVRVLLRENAGAGHDLMEARDENGSTPLHIASRTGNLDMVRFLVEDCHAEVEARNDDGLTPLELAVSTTSTPIHGQDRDSVTRYLVNLPLDHIGGTALHRASARGDLDIVRFLVDQCQANVEVANHGGLTALHHASYAGHRTIVTHLVVHGRANIEATTNDGLTALHCAGWNGHTELVRYLLDVCPTLLDAPNKDGSTVLHCASWNGHMEVVRYLVEQRHVNVETINNSRLSALDCAKHNGHLEVVEYLSRSMEPMRNPPQNFRLE